MSTVLCLLYLPHTLFPMAGTDRQASRIVEVGNSMAWSDLRGSCRCLLLGVDLDFDTVETSAMETCREVEVIDSHDIE